MSHQPIFGPEQQKPSFIHAISQRKRARSLACTLLGCTALLATCLSLLSGHVTPPPLPKVSWTKPAPAQTTTSLWGDDAAETRPESEHHSGSHAATTTTTTTSPHPSSSSNSAAVSNPECADAYQRPGYLFVGKGKHYNRTRWIPYDAGFLDEPDPPLAAYPPPADINAAFWFEEDGEPDQKYFDHPLTPKPWLFSMVEESRRRGAVLLEKAQKSEPKQDDGQKVDGKKVDGKKVDGQKVDGQKANDHGEQKPKRDGPAAQKFSSAQDFLSFSGSSADDAKWSWVWGRTVLVVSDSIDRYMLQFFCDEFTSAAVEATYHEKKRHTTTTCHVPSFNFTLVHWHLAGMPTESDPSWIWVPTVHLMPFEERLPQIWLNDTAHLVGGQSNTGPDLLLYQSALWDRANFAAVGGAHQYHPVPAPDATATASPAPASTPPPSKMANPSRQATFPELVFFRARMHTLTALLRSTFPSTPLMLRAVTHDRHNPAEDAMLHELDGVARALAEREGTEVFEWGGKVARMKELYLDDMHLGKGPASWLYGNMVLEYVARVAGVGGSC